MLGESEQVNIELLHRTIKSSEANITTEIVDLYEYIDD